MASFEDEFTRKFTPEEKKLFSEVLKHYRKDGPANAPYSEAEMRVAVALKNEFDRSPGSSSIEAAAKAVNQTISGEYNAYITTRQQAAQSKQALAAAEKATQAASKEVSESWGLGTAFAQRNYAKAEDKELAAFKKNLEIKQKAGHADAVYHATLDDIRLPDFANMASRAGLKHDKGGQGR